MKMRAALWLMLTVPAAIGGCADTGGSAANLMKVDVGMSRSEVVAIMGEPPKVDRQGSTEFLIYPGEGDSAAGTANIYPVAIVDGRVTGIGRGLYDQVVRAKAQSDATGQINAPR
jgi:hypothetical protein